MRIADQRLRNYIRNGFRDVEGWLQMPVLWALAHIVEYQQEAGYEGASCEIGVHHGRFLLALEAVTPENQPCYAMDVFDNQALNVDGSGQGVLATFEENVRKFAVHPDRVEPKALDSTSGEAAGFLRSIEGRVQLFSVDGGHTRLHALNDLRVAENTLMPGGVVFLDDAFNPQWPGVVEGMIDYLDQGGKLVPVALVGGKMLLAGISHAPAMIDRLGKACDAKTAHAKLVQLRGHALLSIRPVKS